MTNISKGTTGFSDPRMLGQNQRDPSEGHREGLDRDDFGRTGLDKRKADARGSEAAARLRAPEFSRHMKSALGDREEGRQDEDAAGRDSAAVLLASMRWDGAAQQAPAPTAPPPLSPTLLSVVQDITNLVERQLRIEALSARSTTVHLKLAALPGGELQSLDLSMDGDALDVVLRYGTAELSPALEAAARQLAQSLGDRLSSKRIRIYGQPAEDDAQGDSLSALGDIFAGKAGAS